MVLVGITFLLVLIGVVSYWVGAWKLAKYGFRVSTGTGVMTLLVPPYTLYFTFFRLQQDGKELPTTMWLFGMISTVLMVIVFWAPISLVLTGRMDELEGPVSVAEAAVAAHGKKPEDAAAKKKEKAKEEAEQKKAAEEAAKKPQNVAAAVPMAANVAGRTQKEAKIALVNVGKFEESCEQKDVDGNKVPVCTYSKNQFGNKQGFEVSYVDGRATQITVDQFSVDAPFEPSSLRLIVDVGDPGKAEKKDDKIVFTGNPAFSTLELVKGEDGKVGKVVMKLSDEALQKIEKAAKASQN